MQDPIQVFNALWQRAIDDSPLKQKSAVCVSTIDAAGFPNSRFVDLKEANEQGLVFCTYLDSQKGHDLTANDKAGITIWWDHIGIQARFQGHCARISDDEANWHWKSRSRDAQLTTTCFQQSQPLDELQLLKTKVAEAKLLYAGSDIARPTNWGGFRLVPTRLELLEFRDDRLHIRTCYWREGAEWRQGYLQP